MRNKVNKIKILMVIALCFFAGLGVSRPTFAEGMGISMSPMNQKIILNPGGTYTGSFSISNPQDNTSAFGYSVTVDPFFVDENYNVYFDKSDSFNQIVEWTTTDVGSGLLPIGGVQKINFTINVPEDAPAGGQYAAITVSSDKGVIGLDDSAALSLNQNMAMAHIIYAEIAGTTRHSGEVVNISLPNFIFDGNIAAESTIKNTGNTHGTATYKMQVFPLFSDEEVFTNEEDPQTKTILPNRALLNKTIWEQTPAMGIFNVKYTIEFEGVTTEVNKLVIKCPIWLLFIILFVIILFVIWIFTRTKSKKSSKKAEN